MRIEELNWFDVEHYLQHDDRLLLVLGACEQHGYLSLLSDVKIPFALADAASQQTGVLIAPALNFGCSPYFLSYPGTISLRASTLLDVVEDIVRSVYAHGFRRLLVLNGHGGNNTARIRLYELASALPGLRMTWYGWWESHSTEAVALKHGLKPSHANWLEAFPFTLVTELPEGEKVPPHVPGFMSAEEARQVYGDGSFGGPYLAGESVMNELFAACLVDVLQLLKFEITIANKRVQGETCMASLKKEVIATEKAPKAIGPYSVAIRAGNFVFTSGQLGLDPVTNELVPGGIEAETRQSLTNLSHVLAAAGTSLEYAVKTIVFLRDMGEFAKMNAIYGQFFPQNPPARSTVQAAALPKGGAVEIEVVAIIPE